MHTQCGGISRQVIHCTSETSMDCSYEVPLLTGCAKMRLAHTPNYEQLLSLVKNLGFTH